MHQLIGLVTGSNQLFELAIFVSVSFGVTDHLVDFFIAQTRRGLDDDRLLLARRLVFGRHVQNTVGVDVKADLNLRYATRCRRNVCQVKTTQ